MSASHKPGPSEADLWAQLCDLPEHVRGEIIDGELFTQPRPRPRHSRAITQLSRHLGAIDGEGPGAGWWILIEPGIELPGAREIVPDLAGWRRSTLPGLDLDAPLTTRPDWACEVLSPTNTRHVIVRKQKVYARAGVEWLWHFNPHPEVRALQVFRLVDGQWLLLATCSDEPTVRLPPFEDVELPLAQLWLG
jgi:Uma2 family endonuclease